MSEIILSRISHEWFNLFVYARGVPAGVAGPRGSFRSIESSRYFCHCLWIPVTLPLGKAASGARVGLVRVLFPSLKAYSLVLVYKVSASSDLP